MQVILHNQYLVLIKGIPTLHLEKKLKMINIRV